MLDIIYLNNEKKSDVDLYLFFAGSLESANSSILAAHRHFKEVVGEKVMILW